MENMMSMQHFMSFECLTFITYGILNDALKIFNAHFFFYILALLCVTGTWNNNNAEDRDIKP